ncbi:acyl-coenzyme A oxidase 2, peroxisomal, partial [Tanacetum coccineum]
MAKVTPQLLKRHYKTSPYGDTTLGKVSLRVYGAITPHVLVSVFNGKSCPDANSRAALKLVCDLYALNRIWNDIGTYRNVDYVAPNKAKAIHKLADYLSFQVKDIAKELVDAFDLPDHVIRAPIGRQSPGEAYAEYTQYAGF